MGSNFSEEFLVVETTAFPLTEDEKEELETEDGILPGEAISHFIAKELRRKAYAVSPVMEDWGWWIGVKLRAVTMELGVYHFDKEADKGRYAVTVFGRKTKRWMIWPFKSVSIVAEMQTLQKDLRAILSAAPDTMIVDVTDDFP